MSRDAEGVLFRGSCSRQQPRQAISGGGGGGAKGLSPMRLATGAGGGAGGRRREARPRSGMRLSVSAPPPPPPRSTLTHSKRELTSLDSVVGDGARNDKKKSPAAPASSSTSRRRTLLGVAGAAATTRDDAQPADVSGHTILKTTRTRKPQNTTQRPTTAARRTVRFDRCVRMVLVPARRDLDAAIVDGVWWGAEDVAEFRMAAAKYFSKHSGRVARRTRSIGGDGGGATASEEEPGDHEEGGMRPPISMPAPLLPDKVVVG